ncbi:hypothetical protein K504DRAFT_502610 [Pleomassaria siparia CBS 279.74]|uniref:Uncharacterized protein n=1 Tax=Pleomassaria siparia CBS 279.74 TaxID=1314801 RepID=A0A6G1K7I3_9PLEO|nr:hypothetical protein K504DRAFT_502610 [Pleomassaria siparia CBS 279.74]
MRFDTCALQSSANTSEDEALRSEWGWRDPIVGVAPNSSTQISREGWLHLSV